MNLSTSNLNTLLELESCLTRRGLEVLDESVGLLDRNLRKLPMFVENVEDITLCNFLAR